MDNGTYQAKENITICGSFSMIDVQIGQVVVIKDGDHDDTSFVETPLGTVEVEKKEEIEHLFLIN